MLKNKLFQTDPTTFLNMHKSVKVTYIVVGRKYVILTLSLFVVRT
jgi:hypothetical protein